uniref:Uncharacterized protein n=1 Tax=Oryza nivara TaxID=4536 RepID=A0A0E0G620_ORYNI
MIHRFRSNEPYLPHLPPRVAPIPRNRRTAPISQSHGNRIRHHRRTLALPASRRPPIPNPPQQLHLRRRRIDGNEPPRSYQHPDRRRLTDLLCAAAHDSPSSLTNRRRRFAARRRRLHRCHLRLLCPRSPSLSVIHRHPDHRVAHEGAVLVKCWGGDDLWGGEWGTSSERAPWTRGTRGAIAARDNTRERKRGKSGNFLPRFSTMGPQMSPSTGDLRRLFECLPILGALSIP